MASVETSDRMPTSDDVMMAGVEEEEENLITCFASRQHFRSKAREAGLTDLIVKCTNRIIIAEMMSEDQGIPS